MSTRTPLPGITEILDKNQQPVCFIIKPVAKTDQSYFFTKDNQNPQAGFIVYKKGETIRHHLHKPVKRSIEGTPETLLIRQGKLSMLLFDRDLEEIGEFILEAGDVCMLLGSGHGFKVLEDVVLMEIKQGPYVGRDEDKVFLDESEVKRKI